MSEVDAQSTCTEPALYGEASPFFLDQYMSATPILPALCSTVLAVTAAFSDVRERRIPNVLTFSGAGIGVLYSLFASGWSSMASCFAGMVIGAVCLLPAYLLRGMGAGDVKLLGAIGAWVGAVQIVRVVFYMAAIGGIMAIVKLVMVKRQSMGRPAFSLATGSTAFSATADTRSGNRSSIPYGPAIAVGALFNLLVGLF